VGESINKDVNLSFNVSLHIFSPNPPVPAIIGTPDIHIYPCPGTPRTHGIEIYHCPGTPSTPGIQRYPCPGTPSTPGTPGS